MHRHVTYFFRWKTCFSLFHFPWSGKQYHIVRCFAESANGELCPVMTTIFRTIASFSVLEYLKVFECVFHTNGRGTSTALHRNIGEQ